MAAAADSAAERLRRALSGSDLLLERAPVIDLLSGAIDHHAIATRLRGDSSGLLERAERFGLGRQIGRRVVEHALATVSDERRRWWCRSPPGPRPTAASRTGWWRSSPRARIGEFGGRLALDQFGPLGAFALLKGAAGFGIRLVRGAMSAPSAQS